MTSITLTIGREKEESNSIGLKTSQKELFDAIGDNVFNGPVKLHSFFPEVRLPVKRVPTHSVMDDILQQPESVLISPEGYVFSESFYEPEKNTDKGKGGITTVLDETPYRLTEKETIRQWMTNVPEFQQELVNRGWFYFSAVEQLADNEKEKLGESKHKNLWKRSVDLPNLLKIMLITVTEEDKEKYGLAIRDLEDLSGNVTNTTLIYEGGGFISPKHLITGSAKLDNRNAYIELTDLEHLIYPKTDAQNERELYDKPNTLVRKVSVSIPIKDPEVTYNSKMPHWWEQGVTNRVLTLASDYIDQQNIENASISMGEDKFMVTAQNRNDYIEVVTEPDTKKLLRNVFGIQDFVKRAVGAEYKAHNAVEKSIINRRKQQLGLDK